MIGQYWLSNERSYRKSSLYIIYYACEKTRACAASMLRNPMDIALQKFFDILCDWFLNSLQPDPTARLRWLIFIFSGRTCQTVGFHKATLWYLQSSNYTFEYCLSTDVFFFYPFLAIESNTKPLSYTSRVNYVMSARRSKTLAEHITNYLQCCRAYFKIFHNSYSGNLQNVSF